MDFNDTKDEANFRDEVNSWLSDNADKKEHAKDIYRPAEMSGEGESGESSALKDAKAWQAKKYDAGWACLHWPKDYGGRDGRFSAPPTIYGQMTGERRIYRQSGC